MYAIRLCLEDLGNVGGVDVTLLFQRKGHETDNWEDFKVWEKRMWDSWPIFEVKGNAKSNSKRAGVWNEDMFEEEEEDDENNWRRKHGDRGVLG
jgi:hypothetical protein